MVVRDVDRAEFSVGKESEAGDVGFFVQRPGVFLFRRARDGESGDAVESGGAEVEG